MDLSDLAVKCSCPSRKQPCKHAIGLLFLSFEAPPAEASPPGWITDWLARRAFSDFEPAERRAMGEKVRTLGGGGETGPEQGDSAAGDLHHRWASRTLTVLARILGMEHHG